ncbi:MAG TPA: helix-hairpin-helix domain-containing protein, partial [Thermoanaerobaculia bacterium]|nr:helix-hairpin-helix domain-containing protein [Thermoanaerobaculia bacterium]
MTDKFTVARALDEIARYIELSDPNPFRARAFERAARAVEGIEGDVAALIRSGEIYKTAGIGKAIGPIISEVLESGTSAYLEELRAQYPPGIFDLLRVPGLGLKKIGILHSTFGIGSLDELEQAARDGKVAKLKGFGPKTQTKILDGIEKARRRESQFLLPAGLEIGEWLRGQLATIDEVEDAEVTGSVRRRLEVIRNVNVAVATRDQAAVTAVVRGLLDRWEKVDEGTWKGMARGELDVLVHFADPSAFGLTVLQTTGSREFVTAFEASAKSVKTARTEEELFDKGGIKFVEPE